VKCTSALNVVRGKPTADSFALKISMQTTGEILVIAASVQWAREIMRKIDILCDRS